MSNISFVDDPYSRKVTRLLLLLQIAAMVIVVRLSLIDHFFFALAISFLTFFVLIASLLWLYARYRDFPIIREKRELERLTLKFQKGIQNEEKIIQTAIKTRADLFQSERGEINTALRTLQKNHLENGLAAASVQEAVMEKLESTIPVSLPNEQLETIKQKYQALQDQNNASERKALASKQMLGYELISFRERLQQLAPFTFIRYLGRSLASRRVFAAPLVFLLIGTQVVSSVSATVFTTSSMMASIPTVKSSPLGTALPTGTIVPFPTKMILPTATVTLTTSQTPMATVSPTEMFTATVTPRPLSTLPVQPSNTAYIPVSGGEDNSKCDPSYLGVCIPPSPADLDCKDVPYRRFQVFSPDPHHFDRDGDGIGCES